MIEQIEALLAKLSKGERTLTIIAALLIAGAVTNGLLLGPILDHIKSLEAEIVTKSQTIKRNLRILSFREGILKEYALYMKYLDSGEKKQEEIVAALLRKIETIAAEKSVSVSNIQPGDVSSTSMVQEYKTSLSGEGALINVLGFMHALEESDYLFQISKYGFTPKSKGADVMKFSLDISRVLIAAEKIEGEIPSPAASSVPPQDTSSAGAKAEEAEAEVVVMEAEEEEAAGKSENPIRAAKPDATVEKKEKQTQDAKPAAAVVAGDAGVDEAMGGFALPEQPPANLPKE